MTRFTNYDVFLSFLSAISYVTDVGTDIALVVYFFSTGQQIWGSLTVCFLALAGLTMQVFSFHWHVSDRTLDWKTFIIHILFLAPIHRYWRVLRYGVGSRKSDDTKEIEAAYRELNDVCILRLFETFLEAAPQLVLQLYIVLIDLNNFNALLGVSMFFSLFTVAWSVTAYTDMLHLTFQKLYKRRFLALLIHVCWQTGMITARIVSIVLFATVFHAYVLVALGVHFLMMLVWISSLHAEFGSTVCQQRLFTIVASAVHVFCFLNLNDGKSRYRMCFYYIVMLAETAAAMTVWYTCNNYNSPIWFDVTAFSLVFGSFAFGTMCMLLYYGCCHGSGPAPICEKKARFVRPSGDVFLPAGGAGVMGCQCKENLDPRQHHLHTKEVYKKPSIFETSSPSAHINVWLSASIDLSKEDLVNNTDELLDVSSVTTQHACNHGNQRRQNKLISPQGTSIRPLLDPATASTSFTGLSPSGAGNQEASISDENLIKLFGRCRRDSSDIFNTSGNDSLHNTRHDHDKYSQLQSYPDIPNLVHSRLSSQSKQSLAINNSVNKSLDHSNRNTTQYDQSQSITYMYNWNQYQSRISRDSCTSVEDSLCLPYGRRNGDIHDGIRNTSSGSLYRSARLGHMEQNNSIQEISMRAEFPSKLSNDSTHSLTLNSSKLNGGIISPLDPSRLWEESRLKYSPCYNTYGGSDNNISRDRTPVLTVTPDEARGIIKFSYSDLRQDKFLMNECSNTGRDNALVNVRPQNMRNSTDSFLSVGTNGDDSSGMNLSLLLPDNSGNTNTPLYTRPGLIRTVSKDSALGHRDRTFHYRDRKQKYSPNQGDRSSDYSYSSRDYSSSYLSDRPLSSSRGLSMSGQTNETSSGFQSEGSTNLSEISPFCSNTVSNSNTVNSNTVNNSKHELQYQSTPLTENEINSIAMSPVYPVVSKRASLDTEIDPVLNFTRKLPITDIDQYRDEHKDISGYLSCTPPVRSIHTEKEISTIDSPDLPPIRVSRRSSSNHHRFFKDPCIDDNDGKVGEMKTPKQTEAGSVLEGSKANSSYMERSSLSALLSDMSSSKSCGSKSSVGSFSTDSLERSAKSYTPGGSAMQKASSLPYLVERTDRKFSTFDLDTYSSLPHPRKVSDYLCKNKEEKKKLQQLYHEFDEVNTRPNELDEFNAGDNTQTTNHPAENEVSSGGECVGTFERDHWRASLDKEMKARLVNDLQKLAPKKLYQLKAKHVAMKQSEENTGIVDYTESPYKFRKTQSQVTRESPVYVNDISVSKESLEFEYNSAMTTNMTIFPEYENLYSVGDRLSGCPLATPESFSDVFIEDNSEIYHNEQLGNVSEPSKQDDRFVHSGVNLSGTKSPINLSGINSAFKPVKSRKSVGSTSSPCSNDTYIVSDDSGKENVSTVQSYEQVETSVSKSQSRSEIINTSEPKPPTDICSYSLGTVDTSSFQWSQCSGMESNSAIIEESTTSSATPRNFLKLVGKNVLSFSAYTLPDESSCPSSRHSYTDSIPWEGGSENPSPSFQTVDNKSNLSQLNDYTNSSKPVQRQALKAIDNNRVNTPAFSPIYGQDWRYNREVRSGKRLMSTPKLGSGLELSVSSNNTENELSTSVFRTPHSRRSSGVGRKLSNNTSTWSTQSSPASANSIHEHSTFGLSKTTYI